MAFTLIRNGTLIDGTGRDPVADAAVLIANNRICAAGPAARIPLPDAPIQEIDAAGGFILPGFIDSHVHVMFEGFDMVAMLARPFSLAFYEAIPYLARTLAAGVTGARDASGADAGVQAALAQGLIAGPRLQISITGLSITGGHGDGWMRSGYEFKYLKPYPGKPDGICDGVAEVRRKVREVLRAGAEVIKVSATGGVSSPTDHPDFTQFSPEELAVIVEEAAYRNGVPVMAHAEGAEGIKNAVRAGVHSVEHGIFLDDEAIELMLARGTFLVPTLLAPVALLEEAEAKGTLPAWALEKTREVKEVHFASVARAHRAGVRIAMGTDAGVAPHGSNLRELGLMCSIGMTPMEAIVASTRTAAACLGWGERLGTVEAGKLADLVIVRRDPLADIGSLAQAENIALVMQDGRTVAASGGLV